jgi:hypothetical protein
MTTAETLDRHKTRARAWFEALRQTGGFAAGQGGVT